MKHQLNACFVLVALLATLTASAPHCAAEEPVELFLKQLRANRFFDVTQAYLTRIEKGAPAPKAIKSSIELERAQTYLASASAARTPKVRNDGFEKAEKSLRKFVETSQKHERFAEARLKLGKLLLTRAAVLLEGKEVTEDTRTTARKALDDSGTIFDTIVEDLRAKMKKLKVASGDSAAKALRTQYQSEFLTGILLGGDVRERSADTVKAGSEDYKKRLNAALGKYKELADKYGKFVPGAQAAFFIGRVQEKLGDKKAALDAYRETLKQPEADPLRLAKTEAATRAVELLLGESPPKFKPAVQIGKGWMDGLRPNERMKPQWQMLRVALGKAYLGYSETLKGAEAKKNKSSARSLLVLASKVPGAHLDEARNLLGTIGVEATTDANAPVEPPDSFADGFAKGREFFEEAKTAALPIAVLQEQAKDGGSDEVKAQIAEAEKEVDRLHVQAASMLQQCLGMTTPEDEIASINQARYFLSIVSSKRKRYWDAAVVGEFVARRFPTDSLALQCGLVALGSYQGLLKEADKSRQKPIMRKIEPLAKFLVEKWPEDPNAGAAASILVQTALLDSRWDDAEKYIANIPADSPNRTSFLTNFGNLLWGEYSAKLKEEDGQPSEATAALLERCLKTLAKAMKEAKPAQVNSNVLLGALFLSKGQLSSSKPKEALATLENDVYGPLKRMSGSQPVASPGKGFLADTYRTALKALVAQLTGGDDSDLLPKAKQLMADLRKALAGQPNAEKQLISIFYALAQDIRKQIDSAPPAKKQKLIDAFTLFLGDVGKESTDSTTVHWVAQTFIEMGKSMMGESDPPAAGEARKLLENATAQLQDLLAKDKEMTPDSQRQIQFEIGTTSRLLGEYKEAANAFNSILLEKNSMIDAQVEAALNYQQWAGSLEPAKRERYYQGAISGGRKNPQTGKNTIWGWGRLSQLTANNNAFRATFFDARYRLAECSYLTSQTLKGESRKKYADKASKYILDTVSLYSDLGGPESRKKFDALLRQVQRTQGQKPSGLPAQK